MLPVQAHARDYAMSNSPKISPNDTYVIDEELLSEMDSIELTGLLGELSELELAPEPEDELTVEDDVDEAIDPLTDSD